MLVIAASRLFTPAKVPDITDLCQRVSVAVKQLTNRIIEYPLPKLNKGNGLLLVLAGQKTLFRLTAKLFYDYRRDRTTMQIHVYISLFENHCIMIFAMKIETMYQKKKSVLPG